MEPISTSTGKITPTSDQFVSASRGFSAIFWGIPLSILLTSRAFDIQVLAFMDVPRYVIGSFIVFIGMLHLYHARPLTETWNRTVCRGIVACFLTIYFSPFVHWWSQVPYDPYFAANMLLFSCSVLWLLVLTIRLVSEVGVLVRDHAFYLEGRATLWLVLVYVVAVFTGAVLYLYFGFLRYEYGFRDAVIQAYHVRSIWFDIALLIPFTLVMACVWQAKYRCLHALRIRG